jgi:glycosyltransferase involved in cell wall biosynthesis/ADP-heptose:LPS heptosyltransferase/tetratricopeptide (TPR) repeat protein/ubiquinone/menaquinone biosynthesis C-methylase UbiE
MYANIQKQGWGEQINVIAVKRGSSKGRIMVPRNFLTPVPRPAVVEMDSVKHIIWLRTDSIGDAVLSSSMLPPLRGKYPAASITVVCQEHIAELYEACDAVDRIVTIPTEHRWKDQRHYEQFLDTIRALNPDLLINSVYSVHELSDLKGLEFIPERIAIRQGSQATYTRLISISSEIKSELQRHLAFLHGLGIVCESLEPSTWITQADIDFADTVFRGYGLDSKNTIAFFAGTRTNNRTYEGYADALRPIVERLGCSVIALGGAAEHTINQVQLDALKTKTVNLCGQVTLRQSAAILSRCRIAFGAETGLAHIAAAVRVPHLILIGGGHFGRFMPYSPLTSLVCLPLNCYGCDWTCRYKQVRCIRGVKPYVITRALEDCMSGSSDKTRIYLQNRVPSGYDNHLLASEAIGTFVNPDKVEVIEIGSLDEDERRIAPSSSRGLNKTYFQSFACSKKSHFALFKGYETELYGRAVDPDDCDLKDYQDLLVLSFIRENIPSGSRILDIGGGDSRILKHLKDEYECWNLDKLEGLGNGPVGVNSTGYRLVRDYIGNFNKELPDGYFDFVFSISALEHVPDDNQDYLRNIRDDIERILKPGGYSLHCFDIVIKKDSVWTNKLLPFLCQNLKTITPFVPLEELELDPDLYVMTEKSYQKRWQHITKKSYTEFGKPLSYNILWQKMPSPLIRTSGIIGRFDKANVPKISIVTASFNQAEYLEECIDSIISQNYPNLEYVIMDGGSTDGSVEIIKKYAKYLSYWQSRPDNGQYAAIDEGFKRTTGDIMMWLNSDDKHHSDSLFKAAYIFGKYPDIEWITGRPTTWDEKGKLSVVSDELPLWSREKYLSKTLKEFYIQQESTFWKRTLWDKAGGKLESHLQFAGDLDLWVRFFRHAKLFTVDTFLGGYRCQPRQKTNLSMDKYVQESNQIIDKELADISKGKFSTMLPAPKPVSFNGKEFQEHKKKIVSAGIADGRSEYGLQPQKGNGLTVATSIAPGQLAKQVNAIESWIKLGFDVVSLNCKDEIETLKGVFPNVRFIQTKRDARGIIGRPFVYLDDILEYLKQTDSEIYGIVNSDIYLSGDENVVSFIRSQAKNSLVYGARTEIDSLANLNGPVYERGFDFFFFDKSLISHFPKSDFCIGATWWDYWMPIILILAGCPVKKLVSPFAYHVTHPYKWDEKQWFLMAGKFHEYLRERICERIDSKSLTGHWDLLARMLSTHVHFSIRKAGSVQNKDAYIKILYQSSGPCILEFLEIKSHLIDQTGQQMAKFTIADYYTDRDITIGISFEDYQKADEQNQYGEYLLKSGDAERARNAFIEATRILSDFTAAYDNIGVSYMQKNQPAAALKYFAKALKIDSVYLPTIINSVGVLLRCGEIQTAKNLVLSSAQKFIDSGRHGKAAEIYRAYLWENPSDGEITKALGNVRIIESAGTTAQTKNIPIVFIHCGDSECLKYALAQARLSNPQSKIYLIGDQANDKYDFVEHHDYTKYWQSAERFERVYKHLSPNQLGFELMCFLRWFVLLDFLKAMNIKGCVYSDSDVMIYTDVSEHWQRFANSGMTVSCGASPQFNFIGDVDLLNEFCDFLVQGYADPTSLRQMEDYFEKRPSTDSAGISDMTFFGTFKQKYPNRIVDIVDIVDGSTFDGNINYADGFEMEHGRKKIYWASGRPHGKLIDTTCWHWLAGGHCASGGSQGKLIDTGSLITFNNLHFQGKSKGAIKEYFTGKLQLSPDGKKWSIEKDGNTAHFEPVGRGTTAESITDTVIQTLGETSVKPRIFPQQTTGCGMALDSSDGEITKALGNPGIIESAETTAQTKNIPIVFIHGGDSDCLKYTLAQARLSNPQSKIYLIGDQANDKYDFVEHHDYTKYCQSAQRFERVYKHLSPNSVRFELMCFLRWFVLLDFLKVMNIKGCVSPDSDVMIYTDVSKHWQRFARFGMTISGCDNVFANPHCNFISDVGLLSEFCNSLIQGYTDPTSLRQMEDYFEKRPSKDSPGISDMVFFGKFRQKYPDRIVDISVIADGSKFDVSINGSDGFEMERGRKKIYWASDRPQGKLIATGSLVTFNNLHFQGNSKEFIKDYFTGKLQLSFDGKKWSIREDGNAACFEPAGRGITAESSVDAFLSNRSGNKYLVSAIVSAYNSEQFLRGCLEDLENQTIADKLEIIVVNSGSEQNEESIVKEFQEKYSNIVYIKTEREGLYSAWNRAIKAASGQFLTNANTDDRHRRDAFEVMANTLLKNADVALVYGNQIITDTPNPSFENHHVIEMAKRPEFNRQRLLFGCCVGSQPMWRKSLHDELGGFDETLVCAADWDFWLKIAGRYSFKHIDEFLGLYYRNENGIEHGRKIHSLYERYAVGKRYGNPYISVIKRYDATGNPLVSIIVTAYNAADYISRTIESILIQSYRNFEIIVVDDGSTDNTADIVRGFKNEPIKYFFKENGGVASARNLGLQKSGGAFIIMLDSDDMMTPDYIASHLQGFEQHPETDMVYCDDLLIDEQDKPIRVINRPEYANTDGIISDMFRCGFPVVHFKTCIKRSVFDKLGLYDERLIVAEDYDMMRRFVKQQLKMRHLPAALYLRRLRADSLSKDFNAAKVKSHFDVIRRITETFTPEQLFPDVQWDKLSAEQKPLLVKCKSALVYIGIGEQYLASSAQDYAEAAFEMACAQLDDCCKIEPANQQVRNLREKCQSIRDKRLSKARRNIYQQV